MFLEVLGGLAVGALLFGGRRQRRTVYVERKPEVRLPVYHPPLLPYVPTQCELRSVKHGHIFDEWDRRCNCGTWERDYYLESDLCPFIFRSFSTMKVIDIPCKNLPGGFGTGVITTIVSEDLKSKIRQAEQLHKIKFDRIVFDNNRMRVLFTDEDQSLVDTRQTILSSKRS